MKIADIDSVKSLARVRDILNKVAASQVIRISSADGSGHQPNYFFGGQKSGGH